MPDWYLRLQSVRRTDAWWPVYTAYLDSPEWADVRRRALDNAEGRCERCRDALATQVHHLTYRCAGAEPLHHLQAVCADCHDEWHGFPRTFAERWALAGPPRKEAS